MHLSWPLEDPDCKDVLALYKELITLRKTYPAKPGITSQEVYVYHGETWLAWEYETVSDNWLAVCIHFSPKKKDFALPFKNVQGKNVLLEHKDAVILVDL